MPSVTVVRQSGVTSPTSWTVARVRSALDQHEQGDFYESALLQRGFLRDDRISGCLIDRTNALVSADGGRFSLKPADLLTDPGTVNPKSEDLVPRTLTWWPKTVTTAWQRSTLYDGICLGFGLSQIHWRREARRWKIIRLERWRPENISYSEIDGMYVARTLDKGLVAIDPADPRWFLYTPGGDDSWMCGAVLPLGFPFVMRQWDWRDWARYNEKHGNPIFKVIEPPGADDSGAKNNFYRSVRQMGSSGIVRVPRAEGPNADETQNYDVELIEAKARTYGTFESALKALNTSIAICLKGQNLSTEVSEGAKASTGWHMRVRKDYAETDAATLGDAERTQLIIREGRINESGWDDDAAPWPFWDLTIPEDRAQTAAADNDTSQAVEHFQATGAPLDWNDFFEKRGYKLLPGAEMPALPPAAPKPADTKAPPNKPSEQP